MADQAAPAVPANGPIPVAEQEHKVNAAKSQDINDQSAVLDTQAAEAAMKVQQKYEEERQKRLRPEGDAQYVDLDTSDEFKYYRDDPWLDERSEKVTISDNEHIKYLILGAGCGGLLYGAKLVKSGVPASEIRIIDSAGGIGGTWYWNRYPGLMCDVESYIYLPLLEDMKYMPKHKYSYGQEIRQYLNSLADKFQLSETAMYRTKINSLLWDDEHHQWKVSMNKERKDQSPLELSITTQFIFATSGLLLHPKLPGVTGIETFRGPSFHTSRWMYSVTGGSQSDPTLDKLSDKRVGIIGTGATAIQPVPHLAKYAKHLTIFQRTPSSVDTRGQQETDPKTFSSTVATHPGWWKERNLNMVRHLSDAIKPTDTNLVGDKWSQCHSYRALIGGPNGPTSMEDIPTFVASLYATDMPRAEEIRRRVDDIVNDKQTAQSLKHWYASWCKRPTFHDDYLPCFNQSNVTLVDTDGKGVDSLAATGAVVAGKEYPLDVLIFSTGFRAPLIGGPARRADMTVTGRNGKDMDAKYDESVATLHGVITHDFPNFFIPGPFQAAATANQTFAADVLSDHVAYIITQAQAKYPGQKVVIEPTREAEEMWAGEILRRSLNSAGMAGCTPSYLNGEGVMDSLPMEVKMKAARWGIWGEGLESYMNVLKQWEDDGKLEGLDVQAV
ncbi:hypothetical protein LTR10_015082 [Elasticomyces elasticus]|uniref:FAD/NAD(P)-binding domain-containing protein n=1 Tax=Exophiala sideris TaxID=1016849 RepID=A0ABR0JQU2_9EURO|nr:hypothetical protein LTR10_015082 [Elasticomyces elasticus]KAK5034720.1 hypothetical protein LTR13_006376 [Exophiala sideris]KAK5039957.1 hypothetical protein LTS07_000452 [Exophiala sideris]KAK5068336.1 hypothetical protein LTR69_000454 [Exophiala sideris]KAK5187637.1 hypothetical protein LTR44_000453 [Eurotiomycetes sp. CCFEE 6388]